MNADDVREFARTHHRAVLATRRRDGGVLMSPVAVVADDDGALVVSTSEESAKARNLRRDPVATVCLLNDGFFGEWMYAEGTATVEPLPGAMEALVRYYRSGFGEHPDWDEYRAAMVAERRCILRIAIGRVGPGAGAAA